MTVERDGICLGSIEEQAMCCTPRFLVYDWENLPKLMITGQCCQINCFYDLKFKVSFAK